MDRTFRFLIMDEEMRQEKLERAAAMLSMAMEPNNSYTQKIILDEVGLDYRLLTRDEIEYLLASCNEDF